ncbi:MAG TPA: ABC transporter substrate-binding protein [Burkholderiales bacterium]|nr:ABC transporter substrate-binding protein [Burkholderiales bacterium]
MKAIVLAFAAICGLFAAPAGADAPEKTRVVLAVGGRTTLYYLPLTLAERLGYFQDEGLDVEINDFPGGSRALQALIGHSADVVSGAYEHTIVMQTLAQKVQAFVLQGLNPGLELGIRKDRAADYGWAKDLKGMKIGVSAPGSSTHMLVNHLLASVGLRQDDVSIIGVGTGPSAVAAMRSGQIDALSGVEPVMTLLERSGDLKIVVETITDKGVRDVFGGSMPAATLYARADFIEHNPHTVQALTNAIVRALLWLRHSTTEDVLNMVPPEYLLGDRSLYAASFERLRPTYSQDGMIPKKGVDNSYKVLLAHNQAVRRAPVVWINQTYTNAFVEKALQKYRRE